MSKQVKILIAIAVGLGLLMALITLLDLDFTRWMNCNSPFTPAHDKDSDVCRRLRSAP